MEILLKYKIKKFNKPYPYIVCGTFLYILQKLEQHFLIWRILKISQQINRMNFDTSFQINYNKLTSEEQYQVCMNIYSKKFMNYFIQI